MKKQIVESIKNAILSLQKEGIFTDFEMPEIIVDYPKVEKFGDYTSNVAMALGKMLKQNPLKVAEEIKNKIKADEFEGVEFVAPGYINFYLSKKYLQDKVAEINKAKEKFGDSEIGKGVKINNEFISANPTGPLHLGNGRGGFLGDSIGKVLKKNGFEVVNEYYVNDAGEQSKKLFLTLKGEQEEYTGEYIEELKSKEAIQKLLAEPLDIASVGASKVVIEDFIRPTVTEKMGVYFGSWISEKSLYDDGFVDEAIAKLKAKGLTFEDEGALWLKTTDFGDDKDRVLVKSDGQKTYFASDCGYILNKMERGFDRLIEIWGADHHGYINRFKAAAKALGFQGELEFIIVQLVRLVKDGKEVRMSKRAGNVVYIDELVEKVGHDVVRFFFLMYSPDTHMNFDLGLAEERSEKNPVFYVQYAHTRVCSILRKAAEDKLDFSDADLSKIAEEKELELVRELNKFPELVETAAESYEVHKLSHYAIRLADKFHSFYDVCRVIDKENPELTKARLMLVNAVRIVLLETLRLIGVSAPEKM